MSTHHLKSPITTKLDDKSKHCIWQMTAYRLAIDRIEPQIGNIFKYEMFEACFETYDPIDPVGPLQLNKPDVKLNSKSEHCIWLMTAYRLAINMNENNIKKIYKYGILDKCIEPDH